MVKVTRHKTTLSPRMTIPCFHFCQPGSYLPSFRAFSRICQPVLMCTAWAHIDLPPKCPTYVANSNRPHLCDACDAAYT